MLARLLRIGLLLELAVVTAALHYVAGVQGPAALALALLIALAWPSVLMLTSFALAWGGRMARPRSVQVGPMRTLRMVVQEVLVTLILYRVMLPLGWGALDARLQTATSGRAQRVPVLMIHGFLCNSAYWWLLRRQLDSAGITETYLMDLEPLLGNIDGYAAQVAERIAEIRARTGVRRVLLVGHSMGGLVARAYLRDYTSEDSVAGVLTLGTPHHGTIHATLMLGENAHQMRPASPWITELNESESMPALVPVVSLYSCHDNIVAPQDSSQLACATNITIPGVGHLALAWDAATRRRIVAEIQALVRTRATD